MNLQDARCNNKDIETDVTEIRPEDVERVKVVHNTRHGNTILSSTEITGNFLIRLPTISVSRMTSALELVMTEGFALFKDHFPSAADVENRVI